MSERRVSRIVDHLVTHGTLTIIAHVLNHLPLQWNLISLSPSSQTRSGSPQHPNWRSICTCTGRCQVGIRDDFIVISFNFRDLSFPVLLLVLSVLYSCHIENLRRIVYLMTLTGSSTLLRLWFERTGTSPCFVVLRSVNYGTLGSFRKSSLYPATTFYPNQLLPFSLT